MDCDAIVIGAGVVGLACARELAVNGHEVLVLERGVGIGTGISSRNSEVIHAGLYYPQGSLKARHCVEGRRLLYAYCESRNVPHARCGKLVVATSSSQLEALATLGAKARANGVDDLQWLDGQAAKGLEPQLRCEAAWLSPSSGIVDSHALMLALQGDAERHGATFVFRSPVEGIDLRHGTVRVNVGGNDPMTIEAAAVVNAAGLDAVAMAHRMDGFPATLIPQAYLAKGNYFSLGGRAPFSRLIYPLPEPGGLGVHLTLDLGRQARFGPDVQWLEPGQPIDYAVDPARSEHFYSEIRRYWPQLPDGALQPDYSGVRPKISAAGEAAADFRILGPAEHGAPGIIQLFGIESPGLTASLSIARQVAGMVAETCSIRPLRLQN